MGESHMRLQFQYGQIVIDLCDRICNRDGYYMDLGIRHLREKYCMGNEALKFDRLGFIFTDSLHHALIAISVDKRPENMLASDDNSLRMNAKTGANDGKGLTRSGLLDASPQLRRSLYCFINWISAHKVDQFGYSRVHCAGRDGIQGPADSPSLVVVTRLLPQFQYH
jgi:hypothetical protein